MAGLVDRHSVLCINDIEEVLQVSLGTLFYYYSASLLNRGAILSVVVSNIISLFLLSGLDALFTDIWKDIRCQ